MFSMPLKILLFIVSSAVCSAALAFDTETHALITREAISRSGLGGGTIQARMMLDRLDQNNIFNLFWKSQNDHFGPTPFTTSPWGEVTDITTPSVGLVSESIGSVTQPGITTCGTYTSSSAGTVLQRADGAFEKFKGVGTFGY